jgi:putative transposase
MPFAWRSAKSVGRPRLAIIDGSAGLATALREQWTTLAIQRCTAHKLRNLKAKAPARGARGRVPTDDRRREPHPRRSGARPFTKKWRLRCPAVVECLDEAGDDLFTFLRFPKTQWKALRTTNALERVNGEFRRRTKTQSELPGQEAVLLLLFGLLRSGHMKLTENRRLGGDGTRRAGHVTQLLRAG